ncbi:MAG: cytochrome C [Candidatus Rokubacteria bacterium]|nr:cytochrome C [Candidatus Rokubacteria bacterium]
MPILLAVLLSWLLGPVSEAHAVPSFARQTGQACTVCHTTFPELTPYGRLFKLQGYVLSGGGPWIPPVAGMAQAALTHTDRAQPGGVAPGFGSNDELTLQEASLFYAGKIAWKIGAFVQGTYDGVADHWAIDNTDVRFADTVSLGGKSLTFGVTLNNNPTVQDVWNTTPAWRFPYQTSSVAPAPAAATMLEGGFAQQVAGLGAYVFWNNLLYVEVTPYRSLSRDTQRSFGINTDGENTIRGFAPYWRIALDHNRGRHSASIGTYGMVANTFPGQERGAGTDRLTDLAVDGQYQYLGAEHVVTLQASWIHENQSRPASQALGVSANRSDTLQSLTAAASYLYDRTYRLTLSYFDIHGGRDTGLYQPGSVGGSRTGSPDSDGFIFQLDYLPFNKKPLPFYPWLNVKFSVQYILYDRFNGAHHDYDGSGRDASNNNTLNIFAWAAF